MVTAIRIGFTFYNGTSIEGSLVSAEGIIDKIDRNYIILSMALWTNIKTTISLLLELSQKPQPLYCQRYNHDILLAL